MFGNNFSLVLEYSKLKKKKIRNLGYSGLTRNSVEKELKSENSTRFFVTCVIRINQVFDLFFPALKRKRHCIYKVNGRLIADVKYTLIMTLNC